MNSNDKSATDPARKPPLARIAKLLARHLREIERGRERYSKAEAALGKALALGVPLSVPITLPGGSVKIVRDQFAVKNVAFKATKVSRFVVEAYRPDKHQEAAK